MGATVGNKISVCLLTYNHVHLIETTLRSVLKQTLHDYEVLVSDDCSNDGTWEAILSACRRDARVRAVRTPRNLGMAGNANFAVAQCDRPYLALLHHDDLYREDLLEKWASVLEQYPRVAYVFNPYAIHGRDAVTREPIPSGSINGRWLLDAYLLPRWGCIVRGTAMVRRSAWDSVGGMRTQFGMLADVDLWMRLARRWPVGYVDEPVVIARQIRPAYYPVEYREGTWSWARQKLLYEIHATNRLEMLDRKTLLGQMHWQLFRFRLSAETAKWLAYAVVRRRPDMLLTAHEGQTAHDLMALRLLRRALARGTEIICR